MANHAVTCKLCDLERPLCKSHIIPKAFFRDAKASEPDRGLNMVTQERIEIGKMAGEYERLLCRDCETLVGRYDDYGIRFFRQEVGVRLGKLGDEMVPKDIDIIDEIDLTGLRIFIISVLWRASISSRPFFANVQLGPFEHIAKQIILDKNLLTDQFPFYMTRYSEADNAKNIMFNPVPSMQEGRRFYTLNMGGFNIWVKVDGRELRDPFRYVWEVLTERGSLLVFEKKFIGSVEHSVVQRLVLSAHANSQKQIPRSGR